MSDLSQRLLRAHLITLLGAALAAGCAEDSRPHEEYCVTVDADEACLETEEEWESLVGRETCSDPVRRIIAVHGFSGRSEDVEPYYYYFYDTGDAPVFDECCYEVTFKDLRGQSCVIGRPLVDGGQPVIAAARVGGAAADWADAEQHPVLAGLSAEQRRRLSDFWAEAGLMEHASVDAFARVSLDLMALGAPADLLRRTHEAALDEIRHARQSLALASAYRGAPIRPSALPEAAGTSGAVSLVELAVATAREGCIGETLAAVLAAEQLARATDPAVRAVLRGIVRDESRHAELAWATVRWALAEGGLPVREALREVFTHAEDALPAAVEPLADAQDCAAHGLLGRAQTRRALERALRRVVAPAARALVG